MHGVALDLSLNPDINPSLSSAFKKKKKKTYNIIYLLALPQQQFYISAPLSCLYLLGISAVGRPVFSLFILRPVPTYYQRDLHKPQI